MVEWGSSHSTAKTDFIARVPFRDSQTRSHFPARAASIAAMSIFPIVIMESMARFAAARSGSVVASSSTRGVICQEKPQRSLHQPQALYWPPLPTIASQ